MVLRAIEASHVIAYQDGGHRSLREGVVVTDDDAIVHFPTMLPTSRRHIRYGRRG